MSADKKLNLKPILDCVSNSISLTLSSNVSELGIRSSPSLTSPGSDGFERI